MKHLLYCIFEEEAVALPKEWKGRVGLLHARGLSAALSRSATVASPPPLEDLLEYERVVEWLDERRSVIPLRYGNVLDSEASVVELLARRGKEFHELLAELDGKTELGLRILLHEPRAGPPIFSPLASASSPGTAYLDSLRKRFASEGGLSGAESRLVDRIRESVRHLHAAIASELRPAPHGRLLSLYLLLPKKNVNECRRCLLPLVEDTSWKVLLTGPWPPYHTVALRAAAHA